MKLEELRSHLETDATKKCVEQEKTIKKLNGIISSLQDRITKRECDVISLANRCYALSRGQFCSYCRITTPCPSSYRKGELLK